MKKYELVTFAMYLLGGGDNALDIEDIAVKSDELSSGAFSWRKYKERINLELVGFAVRDAKKPKYGGFVTGSHAKGWRLTPDGVVLAKKLEEKLGTTNQVEVQPTRSRNLEKSRITKEITRVSNSSAFKEWKVIGKATKEALCQLLRINAYSSADSVQVKITRLSNIVGEDKEIDAFVEYVIREKGELV